VPADRLTVLYDRDCGFCRWSVAWLLRNTQPGSIRAHEIQSSDGVALLDAAGVPEHRRLATAHAVPTDGPPAALRSGADATALVTGVLRGRAGRGVGLAIRAIPGPLRRGGYGWIASHRTAVGRLVSAARRADADALLAEHGGGGR